jgi:hypothetical protein
MAPNHRKRYHGTQLADLELGAKKQLLDFAEGKKPQMRAVEEPGRLVGPVSGDQGTDDAVMPHVRDAGHDTAVRRKPGLGPGGATHGLAQMLENVAADNRVERACRQREIEMFDVAGKDLVKTPRRLVSRPRVEFDTDDGCLLSGLEGLATPAAPQPISRTDRAVCGTSTRTSGRSWAK